MNKIGTIRTDFPAKFGIPRQSGLVEELKGKIYFEPQYHNMDAFRGLDGYSHIWLLWQFSENMEKTAPISVKPPRLGGNTRMGVFATRSPFRPNHIGLSCVKLEAVEWEEKSGPVITVSGIDLMDRTPILDIKPYLPYVDCHPEATGGFGSQVKDYGLKVVFPADLLAQIPIEKHKAVIGVLEQDPRPAYHKDPERKYGITFAGFDVRFYVKDGVLTVCEIEQKKDFMI
ncbi:tRNA (N6-threonylcarbamoyladenosine(37)-N6)-methyltransferase TrmO [[Clostridium] polysaccharolyticum]|uniref:tRNA-Thr(GGU) m(6)t(6)A37 methyltransferase TsaA n=1 Tax=[Clostridium] polysaccharolyticum TaxID=29364 RepID=A0A1I0DEG8_9FIRM|nr:tRNA (N6-threonylcarbamoyladenosine(37)-N6)-methyltransferase TrmO [[Clostridium] polysaccharolyticum]SET30741.1 tRNA-Thr(GGU) m(6)t(6)A37 methyltransferase TsaA [[Clostridium] polysaccharolyticum]